MKRHLIHIFIACFFFLIPFSVFADEIEIVSITPIINDDEIIVRDETGYNFSVELYDSDQELSFNVVIKNTTNVRLFIREISVSSPTNPNLQYSYVGIRSGDVINPNGTKEFQLTIKSREGATDHSFDDNFVFNINYDRNEVNPTPSSPSPSTSVPPGLTPSPGTGENPGQNNNNNNTGVFDDFTNPQTGVFKFMVLVFMVLVVVAGMKIGKKKFHIFLFALLSVLLIQNVYAVNVGFSIRGHVIYKATYDVNIQLNGGNLGGVEDDISCKIIDGESLDMSQFKRQYYHIDHLVINGEIAAFTESLLVTKNMNISIVWERDYYYVTVDPNGGSYLGIGSTKDYRVAAGDYFEVQTPVSLSQVFREWQINPTSKRINNGRILVDCNITLKALWEDTYYTLTIDPNGGSYEGITENVVVNYRKNEVVPLATPTKAGAVFAYWEKDVTRHTEDTIKMDHDYTLKAVYTDLYFNFQIDPNGGIYMGSSEIYTTRVRAGESIHVEDITRTGYFFNNWIDGNGDYIISNDFVVDTNISLTAQWAISACRIGNRHFTSLRAAYSNAEDGDVITFLNNVTGDFVNNKNITLDLNGYELDGVLTNEASLVIVNGIVKNTNGTAVINNGVLTLGVNDGVVSTALMGFRGSTFGLEQNGTFRYYDGFIEGQTAMTGGYTSTPVISGATYYPFLGHNENQNRQYMKLDSGADALVKTTTNGVIFFTDIQDAVNFAAVNNYSITVLRDFEWTTNVTVPADKMTDIYLDGKSPIFKSIVTNDGSLVIHDNNHNGELKFTGTLVNNGILTLSHTRMTQTSTGNLISNKNHLILEDSTITSGEGYALGLTSSSATLDLDNNSYIRSDNGTAIYNTSSNFILTTGHVLSGNKAILNHGGSVTLSGGEVKAYTASEQYVYGVYNESSGIVKLEGGSIVAQNSDHSAYGVYNENTSSQVRLINGTITVGETSVGYGIYNGTNLITGGSVHSTGYGVYGGAVTLGVDDPTISIVSPEIVGDVYGVHSSALTVYDGIIKGKLGARASLTSLRIQSNTGLFYEKVDEYYHLYLVTGSDFFDVDGVRYGSFGTAYEAIAGNSGTIKLVKSFTSGEEFPEIEEGKTITFNLNGRTIVTSASFKNKGTFIIQDTSEDEHGVIHGEMNEPVIVNEGTLSIQSGKIIGDSQVIQNLSGEVQLIGGTIQLDYNDSADKMAIQNLGTVKLMGSSLLASCLDTTNGASIIGIYNNGNVQILSGSLEVSTNGLTGYGVLNGSSDGQLSMTGGTISVLTGSTSYGISGGTNQITNGTIMAGAQEEQTALGYGIYQGVNTITNGTITGSSYGVYGGESNLGVEDDNLSITSPLIVGELYGVYGGHFNFYDGLLKGKTSAYQEDALDYFQNGTEPYVTMQEEYQVAYLVENNDFFFEVNGTEYNGFRRALHDVEENGTIKVIRDLTYLDILPAVEKDVVIDLNGHIMSYNSSLINVAHLTIIDSSTNHNGKMFSLTSEATIANDGGVVTLESGIISGDYQGIHNNEGEVYITGGQILMESNKLVMYGVYNQKGSVSLTGGSISLTHTDEAHNTSMNVYGIYNDDISDNSVLVDGGNIAIVDTNGGNVYGIYNSSSSIRANNQLVSGNIDVYGYYYSCGIYFGDNTITGGMIHAQSDAGIAVGIYGGKNAFEDGSISTDGNNLANTYGIQSGQNTISGGTITATSRGAKVSYGIYQGTNTITDGTITGASAGSSKGYGVGSGTSVITGGIITGAGYGIYQGTHTLGEDDKIVGSTTPIIVGELFGVYDSNVNFYDGIIKGSSGTYRNSNFTLAEDVDTHSEILDGYYIYYMTKKPSFFEVDGIDYISFVKAYNAITGPEGTIKVTDSLETTDSLPTIAADKLVYLDLNGHTLSYSTNLTNRGTLIIRDSSEEKTGVFNTKNYTSIINYGILNLESGTLQSSYSVISNQANSFVNMSGGKVSLVYYSVADYAAIWNYGSLNITGGEIYAANQIASASNYYVYGIYNYASGSVGIKDASLTVVASQLRGYGVCNENTNSTFNMMSGSISVTANYNSYGVNSGKNSIYGGTINAVSTNTSSSYLGYGINGGNNTIRGGTIQGTDYGIYNGTSVIGVNDGNVDGENPELIGGLYGLYNGTAKFYDGVLKGRTNGFLYETITEIADNTVYNYRFEDGYQTYSLTAAVDFFEVNGTRYRTINDAYNSITGTSGTIKVLGSFFSTANLPSFINGRTITLDLNGQTIYYLKTLTNSGVLNIVDTSDEKNGVFGSSSTSATLISNNGTINLESGTLFGSYRVIENNSGSTTNITGGEIKIEQSGNNNLIAIYNNKGVINMSGGKVSVLRTNPVSHNDYYSYGIYNYRYADSKFIMTGGELVVHDLMRNAYGIHCEGYTAPVNDISGGSITVTAYNTGVGIYYGVNTVTGGTITATTYGIQSGTNTIGRNDDTLSDSTPSITGDIYAINASSVKFYDGVLRGKTAAYNEGAINGAPADTTLYHRTIDGYDVCSLTASANFLEVNGTGYNSFRAAYAAIRGVQGTIKVTASATTSSAFPTIENGKEITIDLNGNRIVMSTIIQNSGTLTIDDTSSSQNGSMYYPITSNYLINNNGTLNLNAGILSSAYRVVYSSATASIFNMTGGQVKVESTRTSTLYGVYIDYGTMNMSGGEIRIIHPVVSSRSEYYSYGVRLNSTSDAKFNMTGGNIYVRDDHYAAYGIHGNNASPRINITSGNIDVEGYSYSYGISNSTSNIDDVQIVSTAVNSPGSGYGIKSGTHVVHGGFITGSGYGIYDATLTLGDDDDAISATNPEIVGDLYGVYSGYVTFYDGVIKGKTAATSSAAIQKVPNDMKQKHERIDDYDNLTLTLAGAYLEVDGVQYNSLKKAYNSIEGDSGTITVIAPVETEADLPTIAEGKDITFDLNGFEVVYTQPIRNNGQFTLTDTSEDQDGYLISTSNKYAVIYNNGTFNLHDGSMVGVFRGIENTGFVYIDSGMMIVQSTVSSLYGIYNNGGQVEITGGEIRVNHTNTPDSSSYYAYAIYNTSNSLNEVRLDGGTLTVNDARGGNSYGIYDPDQNPKNYIISGTMNIYGSQEALGIHYGTNTVTGGNIYVSAVYAPSYGLNRGNNNVSGGNIEVYSSRGQNAYAIRYGTTVISGGNITATSTTAGNAYGILESTSTITGGTITSSGYGIYNSTVVLGVLDDHMEISSPEIVGGTYGVYKGKITFYDGIIKGKTEAYDSSVTITLLIDGYELKKYTTSEYQVAHLGDYEEPHYEANGTGYSSFQQAMEALPNGTGTIKVLKVDTHNSVIPATIGSDKNVTLDLNGKTLTLIDSIVNTGTFTIIDNSASHDGKIHCTSTVNSTVRNNGGSFTMQNGTLTSVFRTISNNGGAVVVNGGSLKVVSSEQDLYIIRNDGGSITINNGNTLLEHTNAPKSSNYHAYTIYNTDNADNVVTLNGGNISVNDPEGGYAYFVYNVGDSYGQHDYIHGGNININGYQNSYILYRGVNEITDGIINLSNTRNYAIAIYYGRNTISGGTMTVQGGTNTDTYGLYYESSTVTGGTISVTSRSGYSGFAIYDGTNEISGGELKGYGGSNGYGIANGFNTIYGGAVIYGSTHGLTGGTYTIGVDDSTLSIDYPSITGGSYGISGGNVKFYDGILRGKTRAYTGVTWQGTPSNTSGVTETVGEYKVYYLQRNS